ncbi:MAG: prepilin-type N-terminal cleavage/methylation domain-containing protein [Candidatus Omnitrophota bacterium]
MAGARRPYNTMMIKNRSGFTLVELVITIVVLGIVMIPLGFMSMEYLRAIVYARNLTAAQNLAKVEMAKVNNLSFSDTTLADGYDTTISNYEGYSYDVRRTVNYAAGWDNNLKQVRVRVYPAGETSAHLVDLITYVAAVSFGAGSAGGAVSGGGQADSLSVSGGDISGSLLQNITLENTGSSSITITGVIITFSGQSGIKLSTITMDGTGRWSGNAASGSTITFDTNFTLSPSTAYSNTGLFEFSKNLSSVASLVFIMSDATQTASYAW